MEKAKSTLFFFKYKEKFSIYQKCSTRLYGPFSPPYFE